MLWREGPIESTLPAYYIQCNETQMGARADGDRMIIDTAGFMYWPHDRIKGGMVSTSQVAEIERHAPEVYLLLGQLDVEIAMPSKESLQQITIIAAETGDLGDSLRGPRSSRTGVGTQSRDCYR